jgi:exopolyphosphatase / guanosine-5'-triphosphate,3'-diphosphate pyrophosphatase
LQKEPCARGRNKKVEDPAKDAQASQSGAQREGGHGSPVSASNGSIPLKTGPQQVARAGRPQIVADATDAPARPKRRRRKRKSKRPFTAASQTVALKKESAVPIVPLVPPLSEAPFRADLYAALDLGTNNCRLLIAAPTRPGQFRVVDAFSRIVRLGEGLTATGQLSQVAMDRAVEALKICAEKLSGRTIRKFRLIATEACRAASNGEDFLARVARETGLNLEIVDRETEARLAVSGCGPLVSPHVNAMVLFDIGGGSSEVALIDRTRRRSPRLSDQIVAWTSLPVGVVSLAERFGGKDVTPQVYSEMVYDVLSMIEKFDGRHALGSLARGDRFHLLGTSGTVTTLAGIHLGLARYDRRRVDGLWMQDSEVAAMSQKLQSWSFEERVANACIGAERADLVLAGCAILDAIRHTWPSERMRVADRGLREGILSEMMSSDGAWRRQSAGARL